MNSAKEKKLLVSVVIPARNEAARLGECLRTLKNQSYSPIEIIVVDNASSDDTAQVAAGLADKVIVEPRVGITYAKNAGIAQARGEFIATTDADCAVDKRWAEELLSMFSDPAVASVGGANLPSLQATRFESCVDMLLVLLSAQAGSRYRQNGNSKTDTFHNPGCNVMYRRSALEEIGGFNESLVTVEDEELDWRLLRKGHRLLFNPLARVYHNRRSTWPGFARQIYRFGIGRGQFFRLYPRFSQLVRFVPLVITLTWLGFAARAVVFPSLLWFFLLATVFAASAAAGISFWLSIQTGMQDFFRYLGLLTVAWFSWSWGILHGLMYRKEKKNPQVISAGSITKSNKDFFNDTASLYERINQRVISDGDWYFCSILEIIKNMAPRGGFLDVGCGTGAIIKQARVFFSPIAGIDIAVNMLTAEPIPASVICADAYALPFKAGAFSVVSCHAALHHFFDFSSVIKEIHRVLKQGGILYIDHEVNSGFLRRFRLPMIFYRSIWGMDKRYRRQSASADIEQFRLAEYHTLTKKGVDIPRLIQELEQAGFAVVMRTCHCWGISTITNRLFRMLRVKRFPQLISPFCMILAKKEH